MKTPSMKKIINKLASLILLSVASTTAGYAQTTPALSSLETSKDARAVALGGMSLLDTDVQYLYSNPSSIFGDSNILSVSTSLLGYGRTEGTEGRLINSTTSVAWRFLPRHAIFAGFRYEGGLRYTEITDKFGTEGKEKRPFDLIGDVGYAFEVSERFSAYTTVSLIQSYTGRGTYGVVFGLGGAYITQLRVSGIPFRMMLSGRISDFGPNIYYSRKDAFPMPAKAAITADISTTGSNTHTFGIALGGSGRFIPSGHRTGEANLGLEYKYRETGSVRLGYRQGIGISSALTAGGGISYEGLRLDLGYLHALQKEAMDSMILTLSFDY